MHSQGNSNMAIITLSVHSDDITDESKNEIARIFNVNWDDWPDYYDSSFGRIGIAVLSTSPLQKEVQKWFDDIGINTLDPTQMRFEWKIIEHRMLGEYTVKSLITFYKPKYPTLFRLACL